MVLGNKIKKAGLIVGYVALMGNLLLAINAIVTLFLEFSNLPSTIFNFFQGGGYLCLLFLIAICCSYVFLKKECLSKYFKSFVICQFIPYAFIFLIVISKGYKYFINSHFEEDINTLLWIYIQPITFCVVICIYYICKSINREKYMR